MSREVCGICWCPYQEDGSCGCNPLDDAMRVPFRLAKAYEHGYTAGVAHEAVRVSVRLAQSYENGYNAGVAHERERIIRLLEEMQREVRDAHNYYGFAARRIREST